MIVNLTAKTRYDLSKVDDMKRLLDNWRKSIERNSTARFYSVLQDVEPYEFYDGPIKAYQNAKIICKKLRTHFPNTARASLAQITPITIPKAFGFINPTPAQPSYNSFQELLDAYQTPSLLSYREAGPVENPSSLFANIQLPEMTPSFQQSYAPFQELLDSNQIPTSKSNSAAGPAEDPSSLFANIQLPDVRPSVDTFSSISWDLTPGTSSSIQAPSSSLLYLPEMEAGTIYVISMAPINSSGDIYHILAYLMLVLAYHREPALKIQLNFDIDPSVTSGKPLSTTLTVGDQVKRSIDFARTLGLGGYFTTQELPYNNVGREKVRQATVCDFFREQSHVRPICYVDQMATTVFIAQHVQQYDLGRTTQILNEGFRRRDPVFFDSAMQNKVDKYVAEVISQLSKSKPIIVLHIRHSSKANKALNLPEDFTQRFSNHLLSKGYQVCMILSDDRYVTNYLKATVVAQPFKGDDFVTNDVDFSKQAHLNLLCALKDKTSTLGVIGNTSGTLDLAAFIGLAVYSIHQFTDASISYQECRLAFQMLFLSLGAFKDNVLDANFEEWLVNPRNRLGANLFSAGGAHPVEEIKTKKGNHGYKKMFAVTFFKNGQESSIPIPGAESVVDAAFR